MVVGGVALAGLVGSVAADGEVTAVVSGGTTGCVVVGAADEDGTLVELVGDVGVYFVPPVPLVRSASR